MLEKEIAAVAIPRGNLPKLSTLRKLKHKWKSTQLKEGRSTEDVMIESKWHKYLISATSQITMKSKHMLLSAEESRLIGEG